MLPLLAVLLLQASAPVPLGTYRVQASARVSGLPLVRSLELRGDVVLRPGARPGAVRARLAARGHACELAGALDGPERLVLAAGQRCTFALEDPGVRGDVVATLRSGEARLSGGAIVLELDAELAGTIRSTGLIPGLGGDTAAPVHGAASVRAEGTRDASRAAER